MAHTSTFNELSFSKGWWALNFVSRCIKDVLQVEILPSADTVDNFEMCL